MSYKAIVCKIRTRPHPNADKIQLGVAHGYQVVVSLDTVDGELGVYFPTDGQLSEEMCLANDLISYRDDSGIKKGGFFSPKRRVRAQKFRGEKSEGYWCPISHFAFTEYNLDDLAEGSQFDELNSIPICNKYYTPATKQQMGKQGFKRVNAIFHKHKDTKQFKYESGHIHKNAIIYLTEKMHGTSGRTGHLMDTKKYKRSFWQRVALALQGKNSDATFKVSGMDYLTGTRNTILRDKSQMTFYGNEEFRFIMADRLRDNLHEGETVYYEIVGYTTTGQDIMNPVDTSVVGDKDFTKAFGKRMVYKYGCVPTQCDMYVYRITMTNNQGDTIDLPWEQVKRRCNELCVKYVPEFKFYLTSAKVDEFNLTVDDDSNTVKPYIYDGDADLLTSILDEFVDGPSTIDSTHIREGVGIRVEDCNGVHFLKYKSHAFGMLEGYIKEKDDYVDMEEVS